MQTCRQFISDIQGELRNLNLDDKLPFRLILSKGRDKVSLLIKQDSDSRRLFKTSAVWKFIPSVPLCPTTLTDVPVPGIRQVMRSRQPLPEAFQSSYGDLIKVLTVDGNKEIRQTTLDKYKDLMGREFKDPSVLYWFPLDGHICLPDSEVEEVSAWILAKDALAVDRFNGKGDCSLPLDAAFMCPEYLLDAVKKDLVVELAKITKSLPQDERPNQNTNSK